MVSAPGTHPDTSGHQSSARRLRRQHQQRVPGRSVHYGERRSSQFVEIIGRVHDFGDDADHSADVLGLPFRLRAQKQNPNRFEADARLVHADCPR